MLRRGHLGVTLLLYAPVILIIEQYAPELYLFTLIGIVLLGDLLLPLTLLLGAVFSKRWYRRISFSLCMIPDLDLKVPGIKHRGITHTIWFAIAVSTVFGGISYWLVDIGQVSLDSLPTNQSFRFTIFWAYLGFHAIVTHIVADMLTPRGIRPLAPIHPVKISLGLVRSGNSIANALLLILGICAVVTSVFISV